MHVVVAGDIGGAERLLVEIGRNAKHTEAEHEVALITPNRALFEYLEKGGLLVHDRGPSRENPLAYLVRSLGPRDVAWLAGLLASRRVDIVHTHTFGSHVVGTRAARRARKPQIRTEHGIIHYFDPSCSVFTRWAAARTERFVAVSEHVLRGLARASPAIAARATVVRNGLDVGYFTPQARGEGAFSLAIVCRLTWWKRVDLAIRAAALARADLVVVGDGEDRAKLEALARKLDAPVRFVGLQKDPRPFIAAASAVMSTSEEEPLGLSVLESLAMARPVIAVAEGGVPEIVKDGETGFLVPAGEAELAAAIERARRAPAELQAMGERGRAFVEENCTIARMCQGYAAEYRRLLDDHRAAPRHA
jgi:glycosyltransferase involved in cell wall biosynthesis